MGKICVIFLFALSIASLSASDSRMNAEKQDAAAIQRLVNQTVNGNIGTPRKPKVLDLSRLYGLNTNKVGWGIQLLGKNKVPEIPNNTMSLFIESIMPTM